MYERRIEPPEPRPDWVCPHCREEKNGDEHLYEVDNEYICCDCYGQRSLSAEAYRKYNGTYFFQDDADALADILGDQIFTAIELREELAYGN